MRLAGIAESKLSPIIDPGLTPYCKVGGLLPSPFDNEEPPPSSKSIRRASSVLLPDDMDLTILPNLPQTTFTPPGNVDASKGATTPKSPGSDAPPAVPPKSPRLKLRIQPVAAVLAGSRLQERPNNLHPDPMPQGTVPTDGGISPNPFTYPLKINKTTPDLHIKPFSSFDRADSPAGSSTAASSTTSPFSHRHNPSGGGTASTTPQSATVKLSRSNSVSTLQRTKSNGGIQNFSYRHRREESEGSVLDRGRPTKRIEGVIKKKLGTRYALPEDYTTLPTGCSAFAAPFQMLQEEIEALHRQARTQAEKFEVLRYSEVKDLSRVSLWIPLSPWILLISVRNFDRWMSVASIFVRRMNHSEKVDTISTPEWSNTSNRLDCRSSLGRVCLNKKKPFASSTDLLTSG